MAQGLREGTPTVKYYTDFAGGVNLYLGSRQIKDNETPDAVNCDFKGRAGVGNRQGFTQIGAVADSRTAVYGMSEFHTSSLDQLIKFVSNGSNVALYHSTDEGSWTAFTTTTFTDAKNIDAVQAGDKLYMVNGTSDVMREWTGSTINATSNGTKGTMPEYYDKRIWVIDDTSLDTLNFSGQYGTALGEFNHASAGTITIQPGSGKTIVGLKKFKNYLYAFLEDSIYRISPASAANTFTVELVTNNVGCVSGRSIAQVEEDVYFASYDGVYSLGEVANYTSVRTTNKSLRVQEVFDSMSGVSKGKLVGEYFNFKYHLFYPLYGGSNDSCLVYDIRYQAWQDWRGIAGQDATLYTTSTGTKGIYFGEPSTGKVHKLHSGTTDDGTAISSYWYSKSFDEGLADLMKLYFDTTFIFGDLGGTVTVKVIFNDSETSATDMVTQTKPQGGFGRNAFGRAAFGDAVNTVTVTQVVNQPQRLKAKGQKFAVQYFVSSSGQWRLDGISQKVQAFSHEKFPSANKLN